MLLRKSERPGVVVIESALVMPVFLLFVIGVIVGGLGVFRYQEIAGLAREGSRYASVHGTSYSMATAKLPATPEEIYQKAIAPKAVALDLKKLTYAVTWSPDNRPGSLVTVRVSYQWVPEAFFGGVNLTSTSTVLVSY